ncbi:MAG: hypothetical protein ACOC7K_01540 [bacterium]
MSTLSLALAWGLLAIIASFALMLLYSWFALRSPEKLWIAGGSGMTSAQAEGRFWNSQRELYFLGVLPASAAFGASLGVCVGLWRARNRHRSRDQRATIEHWSMHPLHATVIGAVSGVTFEVMGTFALTARGLSPDDWIALMLLSPLWGLGGAVFGFAFWVALTRRPVHPLYLALAWAILTVVLSFPLFLIFAFLMAPEGKKPHGSGYMAGYVGGAVAIYLLIVLPGSAVLGVILGTVIGVVKRARRRNRDSDSQAA